MFNFLNKKINISNVLCRSHKNNKAYPISCITFCFNFSCHSLDLLSNYIRVMLVDFSHDLYVSKCM